MAEGTTGLGPCEECPRPSGSAVDWPGPDSKLRAQLPKPAWPPQAAPWKSRPLAEWGHQPGSWF